MVAVLGDERLHRFIGGRPATDDELRDRYNRLVAGPSRPEEVWFNWIVRRRSDGQALGTVQATVVTDDGQSIASIAWVIGVDWQNQGFASEAAAGWSNGCVGTALTALSRSSTQSTRHQPWSPGGQAWSRPTNKDTGSRSGGCAVIVALRAERCITPSSRCPAWAAIARFCLRS